MNMKRGKNNVQLVAEGANMPTTADGQAIFMEHGVLYGPAKAANAYQASALPSSSEVLSAALTSGLCTIDK